MISDLQAVHERKMLWSLDIIELNKKISDISNQNHMLAEMNKLGLVDSDFFISQSNSLSQQLNTAKQKKAKIIEATHDESIFITQELIETLDDLPEYLPSFNDEFFDALIDRIDVVGSDTLHFHLKNGLVLTEKTRGSIHS